MSTKIDTAVLLCAGRGRRLGLDGPKVLLDVAGQTLLSRHFTHLAAVGIKRLVIVTGHVKEALTEAVKDLKQRAEQSGNPLPFEVELRFNERYERGSLVSLACAFDALHDGGIWMDADVMYPTSLLAKLVDSPHASCVLLDASSEEQGEEMMLGASGDRVLRIGRTVGDGWDRVGESVGFFKVGKEDAKVFARVLDEEVRAGRLDQEHEEGLNRALESTTFAYELVGDIAWTEVDFPEDVKRAEALAVPQTPVC